MLGVERLHPSQAVSELPDALRAWEGHGERAEGFDAVEDPIAAEAEPRQHARAVAWPRLGTHLADP